MAEVVNFTLQLNADRGPKLKYSPAGLVGSYHGSSVITMRAKTAIDEYIMKTRPESEITEFIRNDLAKKLADSIASSDLLNILENYDPASMMHTFAADLKVLKT